MKILIIRNYPSYLSVENNTYNIQEVGLAKALVRKGHSCDIVFWTNGSEETVVIPVDNYGCVHVYYRQGKTIFKNTVYTGCKNLFNQYDLLQPAEYNQIQAWLLAKNQPQKTVIYHGPYYSTFNRRYNIMCKIFDAVFLKHYVKQETQFLVKSELAKLFLVNKGIKISNICTVGVGIDIQMLTNLQTSCGEPLIRTMTEDFSNLKLLYVGRFEERRNIPFIIDVFRKVLEEYEDARLYMVGSGNQNYLEMIFSLIKKYGLKEKVVWQEKIEQKYLSKVYQLADFFLLPTEYEIFGMVLLEAMYFKTAVITTRNGGSSTLIVNGKNGYIFDTMYADQWASCVLKIYKEEGRLNLIQENASETIASQYTWDILADKFIEQYKIRLERK